jgi:anti-sigma-K factor RskA
MAHSERHEELVAAFALGLPLGSEQAELQRHLAEGCAVCEGLLADFRHASTALASGVPEATPPPELKAKILSAVRFTGPARIEPAPRPASALPWRALAAAAMIGLVALIVDDASLRRQREDLRSQSAELSGKLRTAETALAERVLRARVLESEDVQMLMLGGQGPQPDARARVFWSARARRGILLASNLAPLPSDRQYELWVFQQGKPVNAGVFDVDPKGSALFESTEFPRSDKAVEMFAVTVEPRGGVPAPTGPIVLAGKTS